MSSLLQSLSNTPWFLVILACLTLGLAPFYPEPHIVEKLVEIGVVPVGNTPAEFARQIREQVPLFRELVDLSGLKPQ